MCDFRGKNTVDSFYESARNGKLLGLKCEMGHVTVPPRHSCRVCLSQNLVPFELSGRGEIVSFTEVHVKSKEFPVDVPYTLAIVRLEEGGNLLGVLRVLQPPVKNGTKVVVKFEDVPEYIGKWPKTFFYPG